MRNPKITAWTNEIDAITRDFRSTFGNLDIKALNWKPDAKTWSIAQNIHHLIVTNETYYPAVEKLRKGLYKVPFTGKFEFMRKFFGNLILNAVKPDRKRKMKTFTIWEPQSSDFKEDIVETFSAHQAKFKDFVKGCEDLLAKNAIISSPANSKIVYSLERAFEIIIAHEKRHFEQAKEVMELRVKNQV